MIIAGSPAAVYDVETIAACGKQGLPGFDAVLPCTGHAYYVLELRQSAQQRPDPGQGIGIDDGAAGTRVTEPVFGRVRTEEMRERHRDGAMVGGPRRALAHGIEREE